MNLHAIVRNAITTVTPDVPALLHASAGSVTLGDGKRVPQYAPPVSAMVQVQALSWRDMEMIGGLNIQGEARAVYLAGDWRAVIRPGQHGGDLLEFNGLKWLNVKTLEQWPDWSKLVAVRQLA